MDVLKALKKASGNEYASIVSEGTIADVDGYLDTGNFLFNAQLSGSLFGGIPNNKSICFSGQSTTGKTFLVIETVKRFLKKSKNNFCIWFASEKGVSKEMLKERGVPVEQILLLPVPTVEQFNQQAWDELKQIQVIKEKNPEYNFAFVLDSLGQLGTDKDQADLDKKEFKENMIRAKHVKKVFRDIELKTTYLKIPLLFTNHVYAQTGTFVPMDVIAGGSGVLYSADIIDAMTKAKWKVSDKTVGVILTCNMFKNRHAKENTRIKIKISYEKGLLPYSGLFDWCVDNGVFDKIKGSDDDTDKSDFEKFKDAKKKKGNKGKYKFASSDGELLVTEKICDARPEEIFTKANLKIIDKYAKQFFSYGKEYSKPKAETPEIVPEVPAEEIKEEPKKRGRKPKEEKPVAKKRGRPKVKK